LTACSLYDRQDQWNEDGAAARAGDRLT
jgi:hypothetical protein